MKVHINPVSSARAFCYGITKKAGRLSGLLLLGIWHPVSFAFAQKEGRQQIAAQMRSSMINQLLKPWYPLAIDQQDGGFLSTFSYDFKPVGDQDKMIVTQARDVWSNAKAAELFPNQTCYKSGAAHGFLFLKNKMWDKQYGGFYTYVDRAGNFKKSGFSPKEAYGNAFAIYGLAAYYQLSGNAGALSLAVKDFRWLERHSHDPIYLGYFQHMQRNGTPIKRTTLTPTTIELGYKDQNTSIHLLEAFNELYTVWPDPLLKKRLAEMFYLIRDGLVTPRGYLNLFFYRDWTPVSYRDSSEAVILKHRGLNHVSFGHDVETAYLLLEASHTLGLKNDRLTLTIGKRMLDHALDNGYDKQTGGFYDEGYYFKDKPGITIIAATKNWWAQAEGMNTLLIMDKYFPADQHHYLGTFKQQWQYVQTYLIDSVHGDWYQGGLDKQPQYKMALKGQIWKGTYHTLRGFINCIQSLDPDTIAPQPPENLKVFHTAKGLKAKWSDKDTLSTFFGYNIYVNGKRAMYSPLTTVNVSGYRGKKLSITAIDAYGNESRPCKPVVLN